MQVCDKNHMLKNCQLCLELKHSSNNSVMLLLILISSALATEVNEDCISSEIGADCHHVCDLQFQLGLDYLFLKDPYHPSLVYVYSKKLETIKSCQTEILPEC